jgi:hypothetical protein
MEPVERIYRVSEQSAAAPLAGQSKPAVVANRLQTAHLLLWITSTALVLSCHQPSRAMSQPVASDGPVKVEVPLFSVPKWVEIASIIALAPASGAGIASVALCLSRLALRRFGFPVQPGHWLLLLIGGEVVLGLGLDMATRLGIIDRYRSDPFLLGTALLAATLMTAAAWQSRSALRWRIAFGMVACGSMLTSTMMAVTWCYNALDDPPPFLESSTPIFSTLWSLALLTITGGLGMALVASVVDCFHRGFDLFHWVGVIAFAVAIGVPCVTCLIILGGIV